MEGKTTLKQERLVIIISLYIFTIIYQYRHGSGINTDWFPERALKAQGSRGFGGMLPQEISGVSEWSGYWPIPLSSDKALQIGGLFHLSISTWRVFFILKIYLLWKLWPISIKQQKPVWIHAYNMPRSQHSGHWGVGWGIERGRGLPCHPHQHLQAWLQLLRARNYLLSS